MPNQNELDQLLERIEAEASTLGISLFRAQPIWDDEYLTSIEWRGDKPDSWKDFLKLAATRKVSMLVQITHTFHESAFEPMTPRSLMSQLNGDMREQLEEHEQMLSAARGFANQTGKVQLGWFEGNVFYTWQQETDWYTRVWELVMSHPFEFEEEE